MINDSSSSSSSSDGLSFILKKSNDDVTILNYALDNKTNIKILELVMRLKQGSQEKKASSPTRRPQN